MLSSGEDSDSTAPVQCLRQPSISFLTVRSATGHLGQAGTDIEGLVFDKYQLCKRCTTTQKQIATELTDINTSTKYLNMTANISNHTRS